LAIVGAEGGKLDEAAENVRLLRSSMPDGKLVLILETDGTIDLPRVLALVPDGCIVGSGDTLVKVLELVMMDQQIFVMRRSIAKTAIESAARTTGDNDAAANKVVGELHGPNGSLSPRERQILTSLAEGKSNKLIARQYCLTESTVKVHLKAVLHKLGKQNRTQAAIWAIKHGLNVPDAPSLAPSSRDDGLPPEPP
jgi:two-component system nitrate/nitrite response regulator NarL